MIFTLDIADLQKVEGQKFFLEDDETITIYIVGNGNVFQTIYNKVDVDPEQVIMWRERYLDMAVRCMAVDKEISINVV